jgi:cell division protein FtsQ
MRGRGLERVKAMQQASAAAAAEAYHPELLADEEPRYLRRQKPLEIRRKKFGGRGWAFYRRVLVWTVVGAAGATSAIVAGRFLLYSPQVLLLKPDQIELFGNHSVTREAVLQSFAPDRNRSVLRIPLDARRAEIEKLNWVESASVQRILPNRIRVELTERTPVAFVRNGTQLALIDAHGFGAVLVSLNREGMLLVEANGSVHALAAEACRAKSARSVCKSIRISCAPWT